MTKALAHITAAFPPYLAVVPGPGVQLQVLEAGRIIKQETVTTVKPFMSEFLRA